MTVAHFAMFDKLLPRMQGWAIDIALNVLVIETAFVLISFYTAWIYVKLHRLVLCEGQSQGQTIWLTNTVEVLCVFYVAGAGRKELKTSIFTRGSPSCATPFHSNRSSTHTTCLLIVELIACEIDVRVSSGFMVDSHPFLGIRFRRGKARQNTQVRSVS